MRKVYLHLGTHKTGTSYIQSMLRANADPLRTLGVRPIVGAESNQFLSSIDQHVLRKDWLTGEWQKILYSNENFILANNAQRLALLRELRDILIGSRADVTMIFYVRPAVEWLPSMWAQYVKIASYKYGELDFDQFLESYDYESVLGSIAQLRSEGRTVIRPYVRSMLTNEDVFHDLLNVVDVPLDRVHERVAQPQVNQTPSRRQIELARVYNQNQLPGRASRDHHVKLLDSFLRALHYRDRGPSVAATITRAQLQRMSDRYADVEAALTEGMVDSRTVLPALIDRAPTSYDPDVPPDAVDQYLQNMMILSTMDS